MNTDFEKLMSAKSDEELIVILTSQRKDYRQEVIDAADKEFKRRNIPENKISEVQQTVAEQQIESSIKAEEELELHWKAFAFLSPGLLLFMFSKKYEVEGYTTKSKDLSRFTVYGFCFYIGLVFLIKLANTL